MRIELFAICVSACHIRRKGKKCCFALVDLLSKNFKDLKKPEDACSASTVLKEPSNDQIRVNNVIYVIYFCT